MTPEREMAAGFTHCGNILGDLPLKADHRFFNKKDIH